MFKNKHIIIAMLVTPILAIFAWYGTDMLVGDKPIKAKAGQYFRLAEKANCRWESSLCSLKNNDFEIDITVEKGSDGLAIVNLSSNKKLEGVRISWGINNEQNPPKDMQVEDNKKQKWAVLLSWGGKGGRLYIVVKRDDVLFYSDVATTFVEGISKLTR